MFLDAKQSKDIICPLTIWTVYVKREEEELLTCGVCECVHVFVHVSVNMCLGKDEDSDANTNRTDCTLWGSCSSLILNCMLVSA